jgi:hypothetical protein
MVANPDQGRADSGEVVFLCTVGAPRELPLLFDMEVIVRRQDQERCASITCMIRHYVARRAKVIEDHPHNADERSV